MTVEIKNKLNPRKVFMKCGTCSRAMFHILNDEFDNVKNPEEIASDLLAGGITQKGHQCGMLWGAALAAGTESYDRHSNKNFAVACAIISSKHLVDSFLKRARHVNCRDIAKVNWDNKFEVAFYMLKIIAQGFVYSHCFNLLVKWTPEAISSANHGLSENFKPNSPCLSCSTEVLKKKGASVEESIMVAGFAGGIGLSGHACGALAAVIWYKMLEWGRKNPGKTPVVFHNKEAQNILNLFYKETDNEMVCSTICKRKFNTIDEHTEYIRTGGCKRIIETLAAI